ncbi:MAG TPA: VTT domain-containing protein [Candidatus Dojkabacteria bacterium]|nr:VTT domain-containing protein [Candidatus Dojkabacteria bacterium]
MTTILKLFPNKKKLIPYVLLFATFYLAIFFVFKYFNITREKITLFIGPFGVLGIFVMFLVQFIFSMTPVPDTSLTIISVLLFGPFLGVLPIIAGMLVAAIVHFRIARHYGKAYIIKKYPQSEKTLEELTSKVSVINLVLYRMFAVITFDISSYIAGISNISYKKFLLATLIGLLPIIFTSMLIGLGLFAENAQEVIIIWIAFIGFFILYAIISKKVKPKALV